MIRSELMVAAVTAIVLAGSCRSSQVGQAPPPALTEGVHLITSEAIQGAVFAPDGTLWVVRSGDSLAAERFEGGAGGALNLMERFEIAPKNDAGEWFSDQVWSLAAQGEELMVGGGSDATFAWGGGGRGEIGRQRIEDGGPIHALVASVCWSGRRVTAYLDGGLIAAFDSETRKVTGLRRDEGFRYATFDESGDLMFIPWGEGKDAVVRRTSDFSVAARLPGPSTDRLYGACSKQLGLAAMGRGSARDKRLWIWPWAEGAEATPFESTNGVSPVALEFAHGRGLLVVVWERAGVEVFNVGSPAAPQSVAFHPFPSDWVARERTSDPYLTISPDGRQAVLPIWRDADGDAWASALWVIHLE